MQNKTWVKSIILAASSLTVMSGAIIAPALPAIDNYFQEQNDLLVRLILTMPALSIALLSSFAGGLVDSIGRKKILLISLILYAVAGVAGAFISNLYLLLFSRVVLGAAVSGAMNAATTLIGDYFEGSERNQFMGVQASFMALGGVVYLNLGGLLADVSWRGPFLVYLFAALIFPFASKYLFEPKTEKEEDTDNTPQSRNPKIYFIYIMGLLGMLFFYFIPVQIPFLLKEVSSVSNTMVGLAISVSTVTGAIVSISYGKIKSHLNYATIYSIAFLLMAAGYFVLSQALDYITVIIGLGIAGLGTGIIIPNGNLWLVELSSVSSRGKAIGGMTAAIFAGQFVSPMLSSPLVEAHSLSHAFNIACYAMLVVAALPLVVKFFPK